MFEDIYESTDWYCQSVSDVSLDDMSEVVGEEQLIASCAPCPAGG